MLTAVTFQYLLVKGPGMNIPVAQAMNGHAPSKIPSHANTFAPLERLETRIPTLPAIVEKPSMSQETRPSRITTTWFTASWYKPVSGVSQRTMEGATKPSKTKVTAQVVAARVMAVFAIRVQPLWLLQNEPTPSSHIIGPARIIP